MMPNELQFLEIEHKFIVDERFDRQTFRETIEHLHPTRTSTVRVRDRYFLTEMGRRRKFLIRHRYDPELHQLTLKTLEEDTEVRSEINLDLGHHAGDQQAEIDAFLEQLVVHWSGTLHKDIEVWHFSDIEIVHYHAKTNSRSVQCVEFEATGQSSLTDAIATLERYEHDTGFADQPRSRLSLPQILFPDIAEALSAGEL